MKKLMAIFGVIIFTSFSFTSCGGDKSESDKTTADVAKTDSLVEQNSADSLKKINEGKLDAKFGQVYPLG